MKLNFWHIQSRKQIKTQDLWFRYEIYIGWLVVKNNTAQKTRVISYESHNMNLISLTI